MSLKGLKRGDELEVIIEGEWEPLGTVVNLHHNGICDYVFTNKSRQKQYWDKYEENPGFIWRFNTNGNGVITYNKTVRIKK